MTPWWALQTLFSMYCPSSTRSPPKFLSSIVSMTQKGFGVGFSRLTSPNLVTLCKDYEFPGEESLHWENPLHILEVKLSGGALCDRRNMVIRPCQVRGSIISTAGLYQTFHNLLMLLLFRPSIYLQSFARLHHFSTLPPTRHLSPPPPPLSFSPPLKSPQHTYCRSNPDFP